MARGVFSSCKNATGRTRCLARRAISRVWLGSGPTSGTEHEQSRRGEGGGVGERDHDRWLGSHDHETGFTTIDRVRVRRLEEANGPAVVAEIGDRTEPLTERCGVEAAV